MPGDFAAIRRQVVCDSGGDNRCDFDRSSGSSDSFDDSGQRRLSHVAASLPGLRTGRGPQWAVLSVCPTDIITLILTLAFGTVVLSEIQFIDDVFNNNIENEEIEDDLE